MKESHTTPEQGAPLQNQAQHDFLDFLFTSEHLKVKPFGIETDDYILILEEIQRRFFPYPTYSVKQNINYMKEIGAIEVKRKILPGGYVRLYFKTLRPGTFRPDLIKPDRQSFDSVLLKMRETLRHISLLPGTPTDSYFDYFMQHKETYNNLFFVTDNFTGKIHTPVTRMQAIYRKNILIDGTATKRISIASMTVLTLSTVIQSEKGRNQFTAMVNGGTDIYMKVSGILKLADREKGKDWFLNQLYAPHSNDLVKIFGHASWVSWINRYKKKNEFQNKYCTRQRHSNIAWILQTNEIKIMHKVWKKLYDSKILFLSVNDEIIVKESDLQRSIEIYKEVIDYYFPCYTFNIE